MLNILFLLILGLYLRNDLLSKTNSMSNYHLEKWIYKTILGFLLVAGAIFFMYYSLTHEGRNNWLLYGLICSIGCAIGVYFLSSAAVNKVKSDMIRKQKMRQQSN